jgi:WD40 repeat protein
VSTGKALRKRLFPSCPVAVTDVSLNGKKVLICSDCVWQVWDTDANKEVTQYDEAQGPILCLGFSPGGRYLAASTEGGTVRMWETSTGKLVGNIVGKSGEDIPSTDQDIYQLVFTEDSRRLVMRTWYSVRVWDIVSRKELKWFMPSEQASPMKLALVCSPDGATVAVAEDDGVIRLFDTMSGKAKVSIKTLATDLRFAMTFLPSSSILAVIHRDGWAQLWDFAARREVRRFDWPENTCVTSISPDNTIIAGMEMDSGLSERRPRALFLGRLDGGAVTRFPLAPQQPSLKLAFSADGRMLAWGDKYGAIYFWEMASGKARARILGSQATITDLVFSPDNQTLASASDDTTVLLWNIASIRDDEARQVLAEKDLQFLWAEIASSDAERAFRAMGRLTARPGESLPFLESQLTPAKAPDKNEVSHLIADLDHERFQEREKARIRLEKLGELAAPALRQALKKSPTEEARRRIEGLLKRLTGPVTQPERLREIRAVEVLERIGTPRATALIDRLAQGTEDARLTREARESAKRMQKRRANNGK